MSDIKIITALIQSGETLTWVTGEQLQAALKEANTSEDFLELEGTEPVVGLPPVTEPKQVHGYPRTLIGYRPDGNPVYTGAGINYLLEVVGTNPDKFLPRGFNLEYTLIAGKTRPTGPETYYGVGTPDDFVIPPGYRMDKFEKDQAKYYTQL